MTVGIAALAERGTRVVLVMDKQFTGTLKTEVERTKSLILPNGWIVAYAGDMTFAEGSVERAFNKLESARTALGGWDAVNVVEVVHDALLEHWEHAVNRDVLGPRFLNSKTYRQTDDKTRTEADEAIATYRQDSTCQLLLCGFLGTTGQIYALDLDGQSHEYEFAAIGSGAEVARSMLTWRKTRASDKLARVVYEAYEAKAHAELDPFVGAQVDALVMTGNVSLTGAEPNFRMLKQPIKEFLNNAVRYYDQTPFKRARRTRETAIDLPKLEAPNQDFEAQLDAHLSSLFAPVGEGQA